MEKQGEKKKKKEKQGIDQEVGMITFMLKKILILLWV